MNYFKCFAFIGIQALFYVSLSKSLYLEEIFRFVRLEYLPYRVNGKYLIELWNRWKSYSIFKCCITNKVLIKARYCTQLSWMKVSSVMPMQYSLHNRIWRNPKEDLKTEAEVSKSMSLFVSVVNLSLFTVCWSLVYKRIHLWRCSLTLIHGVLRQFIVLLYRQNYLEFGIYIIRQSKLVILRGSNK